MMDPIVLIAGMAVLALAPFILMMTTSFVKLVVVLHLVRNALGVQQSPPNMAINGLALILTLYIMAPVGAETWELYKQQTVPSPMNIEAGIEIAGNIKEPLQSFLARHASETTVDFLVRTTKVLWPENLSENLTGDSLIVLVPAFAFSELTRAFQIGFLLYLPFIVIDLVISNILLSMGMMMVSPMTISLPFKLLLFVLLDGWTLLMQGLIISYV
jgi:type III secretion protein R